MSKPKKKEQRAWRLPAVFSIVFLIEFQSGSWNNFMSKTVTSRKVFLVHLYADVLVPGLHRSEAAQKLSLVRLLTENQDWTDCNWREQSVLSVVVQHGEAQERAEQLLLRRRRLPYTKKFQNSSTEGTVSRILLWFNGKISIISIIDVRPWIK